MEHSEEALTNDELIDALRECIIDPERIRREPERALTLFDVAKRRRSAFEQRANERYQPRFCDLIRRIKENEVAQRSNAYFTEVLHGEPFRRPGGEHIRIAESQYAILKTEHSELLRQFQSLRIEAEGFRSLRRKIDQELERKREQNEARARREAEERIMRLQEIGRHIESALDAEDIARAESLYASAPESMDRAAFELKCANVRRRQEQRHDLQIFLQREGVLAAESAIGEWPDLTRKDVEHIQTQYLKSWASRALLLDLEDEQALALGCLSKDLLIRARAGSGKTRVLAAKTAYLLNRERVHPDQILLLAFNQKAAQELSDRVRREYRCPAFRSARTFHSLAMSITKPMERIVADERDAEFTSDESQTAFVQELLRSVWNPVQKEMMYRVFRAETRELENLGEFLDEKSYFGFRRNHPQYTLDRKRVKSSGEKWIGDFLFEHGIDYAYEWTRLWGDDPYRPDFTLWGVIPGKDVVIEHWGIDPADSTSTPPKGWKKTRDEYLSEVARKRVYWERQGNGILIETSVADMQNGRETFERILKARLATAGVACTKRDTIDLVEEVFHSTHHLSRMAKLLVGGIQRAKRARMTPLELLAKVQAFDIASERERLFLTLIAESYGIYQRQLTQRRLIDFDDVLLRAIEVVHAARGNARVRIDHERSMNLRELRWVMIDEFQDLANLFYELVDAIRCYAPQVRLVCVGDDWQAINRFAGSSTQYMEKFESHSTRTLEVNLVTNHRSHKAIVDFGNAVMSGRGAPSRARADRTGGECWQLMVEDVPLDTALADARFVAMGEAEARADADHATARWLKACHSILTKKEHANQTFAILSRANWVGGLRSLGMFKSRLRATLLPDERSALTEFDTRVQVETVHRFKGKEADVVIVLDVTEGRFPLLHPDTELMRFFGDTDEIALEDERRLFYVAVTRPTTSLYLISRKERESPFLAGWKFLRHEVDPLDPRYRPSSVDPDLTELVIFGRGTYGVRESLKTRGYSWLKQWTAWLRVLRKTDLGPELRFIEELRQIADPPELNVTVLSRFEPVPAEVSGRRFDNNDEFLGLLA
jgi:DNA helicase-4